MFPRRGQMAAAGSTINDAATRAPSPLADGQAYRPGPAWYLRPDDPGWAAGVGVRIG
jgi:hypothetical protein